MTPKCVEDRHSSEFGVCLKLVYPKLHSLEIISSKSKRPLNKWDDFLILRQTPIHDSVVKTQDLIFHGKISILAGKIPYFTVILRFQK